jgi:integrase
VTERLRKALPEHQFRSRNRAPEDLEFVSRQREQVQSVKKAFNTDRKASGLGADVTPHVCRRTFASRLVMAGVDIPTVMKLMRHKSIAMTMRYAHLSPKHEREAIARLAPPTKNFRCYSGKRGLFLIVRTCNFLISFQAPVAQVDRAQDS